MNSKISEPLRLELKYDKINTKYNRLYEQVTNISLFILASFIAYSIAYIQFEAGWTIFVSKIIVPASLIIIPISIIFGILVSLLIQTGWKLHELLSTHNILND